MEIRSSDNEGEIEDRKNKDKRLFILDDSDTSEKIGSGESTRNRHRTTGEYIGRREAIQKFNEAKEEALQLDREKIIRDYSDKELFKKARINLEGIKEQMEDMSNEELAERAHSNLTEVIRIARSSSNLKGTFQKSLRVAAASSLGIMAILKDRATLSKEEAQAEEVKILKREVGVLKARLEDEVETERKKTIQLIGEAEAYRIELQALKKERAGKRDNIPSPKDKNDKETPSPKRSPKRVSSLKTKTRDNIITSDSDYMEVDKETRKVNLDRPEDWPKVRRPTLCGKRKLINEDIDTQRAIY